MPTHGEALELINNCTWMLETINGVARWHGKSKINQQSIYFSVNGMIKNDFSTQGQDSFYFWTTSLASDTSLSGCVAMSPFAANLMETERFVGMGIRPVRPKNP